MKILAISGSLRAGSSNSAILRVAARVAPPPITVEVHAGLDALPFFNPDLDRALDDPALPFAVCELRQAIAESDAVLISSPEYAHGISGVLKNALDWLVGGTEMVHKREGYINTAPHATHAVAAMAETLRTMTVTLVDSACVAIALPRGQDENALAGNPAIVAPLREALSSLCCVVILSERGESKDLHFAE